MAPSDPTDEAADPAPPRRRRLDAETLYALLIVDLIGGLGAACYAAYEVVNPAAAAYCSVNPLFSCVNVLKSGHTKFLGISLLPDFAVGIIGYSAMLVVAILAYRTFDRRYLKLLALLSGLGLVVVAYLVYTETEIIGSVCLVCTTAHILDVVAFGVTLRLLQMSRPEPEDRAPAALPA